FPKRRSSDLLARNRLKILKKSIVRAVLFLKWGILNCQLLFWLKSRIKLTHICTSLIRLFSQNKSRQFKITHFKKSTALTMLFFNIFTLFLANYFNHYDY